MSQTISHKIYYTIGEVEELLGITAHTLRYWEQEFAMLRPLRKNNQRRYTEKHISIIKLINYFLKEKKYTIEGTQKLLTKENYAIYVAQYDILSSLNRVKQILLEMRDSL